MGSQRHLMPIENRIAAAGAARQQHVRPDVPGHARRRWSTWVSWPRPSSSRSELLPVKWLLSAMHAHYDHAPACSRCRRPSAACALHPADRPLLATVKQRARCSASRRWTPEIGHELSDREIVKLGEQELIFTPGHAPGVWSAHGDTLGRRRAVPRIGQARRPAAVLSWEDLVRSLREASSTPCAACPGTARPDDRPRARVSTVRRRRSDPVNDRHDFPNRLDLHPTALFVAPGAIVVGDSKLGTPRRSGSTACPRAAVQTASRSAATRTSGQLHRAWIGRPRSSREPRHREPSHAICGCVGPDDVLMGMGAVVLSGRSSARGSLISTRTSVRQAVIPPGSLVLALRRRWWAR